jgi:hypothetical protein
VADQTVHDILLSLAIQHSIYSRRFAEGLASRSIELVDQSEAAIADEIRRFYEAVGAVGLSSSAGDRERLDRLVAATRSVRSASFDKALALLREEIDGFVAADIAFQAESIGQAIAIQGVSIDAPAGVLVSRLVGSIPMLGRTLAQWFTGLKAGDAQRIEQAVRQSFWDGQSAEDAIARVRGTRRSGWRDGATQQTRRQVEALTRTAVNHATNVVREQTMLANSDVFSASMWVSVLDGRTSAVCQARDGRIAAVPGKEIPPALSNLPRLDPPEARPPAHPNCRSIMVAVLSKDGLIGDRPYVVDTRTGQQRQVDFRAEAARRGVPVSQVRDEWWKARVGRVPATTTYRDWLSKQTAGFQDEILGPTRGRLFRQGGLGLDSFVDESGHKYTLDELRSRYAGAFDRAGLKKAS